MTDLQHKMIAAAGLTPEDFEPQPTAQDIAEEAYLTAQYNAVLLEILMEE